VIDNVIRGLRHPVALGLFALVLIAGCSGRTTGATNITSLISRVEVSASAQLNAVGSCSEHCTFFMRWRRVGDADWTNGPMHSIGAIGRTAWSDTVSHLALSERYEYQACGKEDAWSGVACVGPDGTPDTTQKFVSAPGANDWPQFGFDGAHSGTNLSEFVIGAGNVSKLTQAWSGTVRDATAPSVANGVVYVAGRRLQSGLGLLAAYPATCRIDGARCRHRLWTASAGSGIAGSTPAAPASLGRVFVGSEDGRLYAFDKADGSLEWTGSTGGPIRSSPTYTGGAVYVGSEDGSLYKFIWSCGSGGATCTPAWKRGTFGAITSSPATDPLPGQSGGRVFVGSADHRLYAFNETSGTLLWTGSTGGPIHSSPMVANGVVYVGSDDGKLYAFQSDCVTQAGNCPAIWSRQTFGAIKASPAVNDPIGPETVYVGSTDGHLYAYTARCDVCSGGGQLLWTGATGGPITSSPAVAGDVVYVGSGDGKLYAFPASGCGTSSCQPLFTASGSGSASSAAIAAGEVYFSDGSGVHAYGLP
jgi:outer membrane protein assembly factor BamB